jgi:hypothetical protein
VTESPVIILGQEPQVWACLAHRAGKWIPLTPRHFPIASSHDEVIERARIKAKIDPDFAQRWSGWHLCAARVDQQVDL